MKYYPILLALCQDLEINPLEGVDSRKTEGRLVLGKSLNIKNILFAEDADEIEKISLVVHSLFIQAEKDFEAGSTESGYFKNCKVAIIKQIAETYQEVILFIMNKRLCPNWGFVIEKGLLYKVVNEDEFDANFKEANKKIRDSHKVLLESIRLSESRMEVKREYFL